MGLSRKGEGISKIKKKTTNQKPLVYTESSTVRTGGKRVGEVEEGAGDRWGRKEP